MTRYAVASRDVDGTRIAQVGGKGAQLGALSRMDGLRVPPFFCVTTDAFRRLVADTPSLDGLLERLARLRPDDREATGALGREIRRALEETPIPDEVADAVLGELARLGEEGGAWAVRSSATAEDLPSASFAGQQDTVLDVVGGEAVLAAVRRCWASLFTDRAVAYRAHHGFDHRKVRMGVVVQRMVVPRASGVLFTAHPVTSNRKVASVEAVPGLGEALVSGRADADGWEVRDGAIVARTVAGGPAALTDEEVLRLVALGRHIEARLGRPQDVEWCLDDEGFQIVQSRPITTLFPIPPADDEENRVYLAVGHQQMMTDPMKPLGLSFWQLTTPRPMAEAGGRLFVDVTDHLSTPAGRAGLLGLAGKNDPLTGDALGTLIERDFVPLRPDQAPVLPRGAPTAADAQPQIETDPAVVEELIERNRASVAALERDIRGKSGTELLDFILADLQELRRLLFAPTSHRAIMTGMEANGWLNEHLEAWLGERNAADTLTLSVPHNVTSEMGLALLDVADAIRPHPEVVHFLERVEDDGFLDAMDDLEGGPEARDAIRGWLREYGMRGVGEIDITRPRWSERPRTLVPLILSHVRSHEPGEAARRFERGRRAAEAKTADLLARLRALPGGERKAEETSRMIDRVRTFAGYREYPKFGMVHRYFLYRRALLEESERLERAGVLRAREDIFWLRFDELREVVRRGRVGEPLEQLIRQRREAFAEYATVTLPRVLTSEGEAVAGSYRREDAPAGALVGLPVSAGMAEGRARVVFDVADADLEPGDILVTRFTDPSWTPLFVAVAGLVTEVGGLMTHGAVIARELGLPAVVGVPNATRLVRDGQRIRVHGTDGYVELSD